MSNKGQTVQWNLMPCRTCVVDPIFWLSVLFSFVQPSSHLILCLYGKRLAHPDTHIGTHETPMPVESQSGPFLQNYRSFN